MPQSYSPVPNKSNAVYAVPVYTEAADGVAAFKAYSDQIDYALTPIGMIAPFVGNAAPTGWLLCDGTPYDQSAYPILARLCGDTFSKDNPAPAGKFRVPDLRGRFPAGVDSGDLSKYFDVPGKKGGSKNVTLVQDNLPAHAHSIPGHNHTASITGSTKGKTDKVAVDHAHEATTTITADGQHQHDTKINAPENFDRSGKSTGAVVASSSTGNLTSQSGNHTHPAATTVKSWTGTHEHEVSLDMSGGNVKVNDSTTGTSGETGKGTPFASLGPYLALNFIVRAG